MVIGDTRTEHVALGTSSVGVLNDKGFVHEKTCSRGETDLEGLQADHYVCVDAAMPNLHPE